MAEGDEVLINVEGKLTPTKVIGVKKSVMQGRLITMQYIQLYIHLNPITIGSYSQYFNEIIIS